jgi:hypothetical protein
MFSKKKRKKPREVTQDSVKREMAKPRVAKSARIAELNLKTARIPAQLSSAQQRALEEVATRN